MGLPGPSGVRILPNHTQLYGAISTRARSERYPATFLTGHVLTSLFPRKGVTRVIGQGMGRCTDSSLGFERVTYDPFSLEPGGQQKTWPTTKVAGYRSDRALVEIDP